jgi:hypothetical protein
VDPANASAPGRTASGSSGAASGGCGPSAAPPTRPERCGRVVEPSRPGEPQPTLRALAESGAARRVLPRRCVARAGPKLVPLRIAPDLCQASPILEGALSVPTRHDAMLQAIAADPTRRRALKLVGGSSWRGAQGPAGGCPPLLATQGGQGWPLLSAVPARPPDKGRGATPRGDTPDPRHDHDSCAAWNEANAPGR